jgi:Cell division protein SepF/O-Antigen ligase/Tetratricopeptide repeat
MTRTGSLLPNRAAKTVPKKVSPFLLVAPAGLIALLLVFATAKDGAFDLRYWAPLAILVLSILLTMLIAGGLQLPRTRPLIVALAAIWGFTAWTLISAAWAQSAANAWEGGARTLLYAALFTVGLTALPDRRLRSWLGTGLVAAVSAIAVVTLIVLLDDGTGAFLAGRLNDPIGYRNGTAALFAFAVWPLIGIAAPRGGNPILRAAALAGAVLMLGLAFLTESRGVAVGLVAGGAVSLAIGPDRLRRAWLALVALAPVAIASERLLRPYDAFDGGQGTVTGADVGAAAEALVLVVLVAFAVGLAVAVFDNGLRSSSRGAGGLRQVAAVGLGTVVVAGLVGALVAIGDPVSYADEKVDEFTSLETQTSEESTRLGSVGGPRYDLWRVAWEEFEEEPVAGIGAGNYFFAYFRERETDRNLTDPHSLPFQLLSETGLIGSALFAAFVVALGFAIGQRARAAPPSDRRWIAGLAAAGTVLLAQTVADWLWLLPGVLGLGFLALALAAAEDPDQATEEILGEGEPSRPGTVRAVEKLTPAPRGGRRRTAAAGNGGGVASTHVVTPRRFSDARQLAVEFKRSKPVILNLQSTDRELSKRLLNFSSGMTYALDGGMQRIAQGIFLLTPQNTEVSAEEKTRILEGGFLNEGSPRRVLNEGSPRRVLNEGSPRAPAGRSIRPARLLGSAALLAAVTSVTLLYLSDLYVREAREASGSDPQHQLDSARTAERLNPVSVTPLYLQASALESQGDREGARDALTAAREQEPDNFVTLGLLGDLEFRARDYEAARDYYRRALELNPRDVGLQQLSKESDKEVNLSGNDPGRGGT